MKVEEVQNYFSKLITEDPDMSAAIAAMKTLIEFIEEDTQSGTLSGLRANLTEAIKNIKETKCSVTSVSSGCELFLRFITLTSSMEHRDFQECKRALVERGNTYLKSMQSARKKISDISQRFIVDGSVILVHSFSRVVIQTLMAAHAKKKITVYATESGPDKSGYKVLQKLKEANIPCTIILDAAIGFIMEKVDFVLLGAEGVVESGGIINKIGSYTVAACAHIMNKPLYVMAESFKFVRLYPLRQHDVPNLYKYEPRDSSSKQDELENNHPLVDYTPPMYITLLFTDLGILTPSAISDELINLYL